MNPIYHGDFYSDKQKTDILLSKFKMLPNVVEFSALSSKDPNLSLDEVRKIFHAEELKLVTAQSYSEAMTAGSSTFFHRQPSV